MGDNRERQVADLWYGLFRGTVADGDVFGLACRNAQVTMLSINCSPSCNLSCRHCFYGFDSPKDDLLTIKRWQEVIDSFLAMGVRHFHVSGKEPLFARDTFSLLTYLREKRRVAQLNYGVITNGTLVMQAREDLKKAQLSYLDFSIDGLRNSHEWLRGEGTYDRTLEGLQHAISEEIAPRIYVSSVAHGLNVDELPEMLRQLSVYMGVRRFFIQPLQPHGRGIDLRDIVPSPKLLDSLIQSIEELLKSKAHPPGLHVVFFLPQTYMPYLYRTSPIVSGALQRYFRELDTGIKVGDSYLEFRFHLTCLSFWRSVQITPDGHYIGCSMALGAPNYWDYAIGNVAQQDPRELFEKSVAPGSLLEKLLPPVHSMLCSEMSCARLCHGGCRLMSHITHGDWSAPQPLCFEDHVST